VKRSEYNNLAKLLKQYNISLKHGKGGHIAVLHGGKRVASLSSTGDMNASRACVDDLVRQQLLPRSAKRIRF
jgi:hypothetical protein